MMCVLVHDGPCLLSLLEAVLCDIIVIDCSQERLRRESLERERQSAQNAIDEELRQQRKQEVSDLLIHNIHSLWGISELTVHCSGIRTRLIYIVILNRTN